MGQEAQIRRLAGARKSKNSPPFLSQEFIIQNHGDIFSCVIVLIMAMFMSNITLPIASMFAVPQYNTTEEGHPVVYTNGPKDIATIVFYTICAIVVHAVLQEYVLDKLQRKLHLSKTKTSKFTESGHLAIFAAYSLAHALFIINQSSYLTDVTQLWSSYPEQHRQMNIHTKVFFLVQLAYWLHQFPEFYFSKVKREEIQARATYSILYLVFIGGAYIMNFTRVGMCMLAIHFLCEFVYHVTRMMHFAEKSNMSQPGFKIFNIIFVVARLLTIALALTTFWYGLRASETKVVDIGAGNFNTPLLRIISLASVCFLQVFFMWNFIMFHLRQMRERSSAAAAAAGSKARNTALRNKQMRKAERKLEKEINEMTEADQDQTRILRSNGKAKAF